MIIDRTQLNRRATSPGVHNNTDWAIRKLIGSSLFWATQTRTIDPVANIAYFTATSILREKQ